MSLQTLPTAFSVPASAPNSPIAIFPAVLGQFAHDWPLNLSILFLSSATLLLGLGAYHLSPVPSTRSLVARLP